MCLLLALDHLKFYTILQSFKNYLHNLPYPAELPGVRRRLLTTGMFLIDFELLQPCFLDVPLDLVSKDCFGLHKCLHKITPQLFISTDMILLQSGTCKLDFCNVIVTMCDFRYVTL